jgi:hypothetical protein
MKAVSMINDELITLFGSPETPEPAVNELEAAYSQGFLQMNGPKPLPGDSQSEEERDQQALLAAIIAIL